uniref:Uncharacterized protein n=1 Tax=Opuntia streptacantha TaxID=393608 RepID=A0A7C9A7H2_OPUST
MMLERSWTILLLLKSSFRKLHKLPEEFDSWIPRRLLSYRERCPRSFSSKIDPGTAPSRELEERSRYESKCIFPSVVGMGPRSLFEERSRNDRECIFPRELGMGPSSSFQERSRCRRECI